VIRLPALLLAGLVLVGSARRAVADPPVTREEVARLLADVASDKYQVREAALHRLEAVARAAKPFLVERRDDPDPEVQRTVRRLLVLAGGDDGGVPAVDVAGARAEGLVTLSFRGTLADALRALDAARPGRVRLPPSGGQAAVEIDAKARPYFEVLDGLLARDGLEVADGGFDGAGQASATVPNGEPLAPPAYDGPFRLDVHSVSSTRTLGRGKATRTTIGLRLRWSPAIQLTSYEPANVVAATDSAGHAYHGVDTQPSGTVGFAPYGRQIGGSFASTLSVAFDLPPDSPPDRLASVDVRIKATLRRDRREARFDVSGSPTLPATVEVPGPERGRTTRVTLESFGPDPDRRVAWNLVSTLVLPKGVGGGAVLPCVELPDGTLRGTYASGSRVVASDGTLRMVERVQGVLPETGPTAVRIVWFEREESVPLVFTLKDVPVR